MKRRTWQFAFVFVTLFQVTTAAKPAATSTMTLASELRIVLGQLIRRLREQSNPGDFNLSQISVLTRLDRDGPATVTSLARAEGVRPQSMGATIDALEAAGMVKGSPHPSDGRQTVLSLTPACVEWIGNNRAAKEDWLSRALDAKLTAAEQHQLASAVDLLKRLAETRA